MAYRKHFSFTDKEAYEHVINKRNASAYIEELVKKDMNNVSIVTLEDVQKIVQQYIHSNPSPTQHNIVPNNNEAELVMDSLQSILQLGLGG